MNRFCQIGLESLQESSQIAKKWGRVGLLCNQGSVTRDFRAAWNVVRDALGKNLVALFGPQHGFFGTKQDNMIETAHDRFQDFNVPLFSLYSETREPTEEMLQGLDTILIDLQIVGCRIYTWKATIAGCLRAAKKYKKRVVVLDRPNPLGGVVLEGRVLDLDCVSFVGEYPIPMRHGLSAAEAALFFNSFIGCELETVNLKNWDPKSYWSDLERPWVLTSPNLPTIDPVYVYPGTVMLEGTNISEGRGTGLPFQFIGAPYIKDSQKLLQRINQFGINLIDGLYLRECQFEPTSQKWAGQTCRGLQLHVVDFRKIRSFDLTIAIMRAFWELSEGGFDWKRTAYEYVHNELPMRIIFGSKKVDQMLTSTSFDIRDVFWNEGLRSYADAVKPFLLYKREFEFPVA
jgi:uncharacterized protein YbbC (DUF1343 family)